ncbi:MAG: 50S ribosomal protein L17, partial [Bacteroidetes bacterium]|nr:50S ribosomal protein L17 [Bacteroidota bacterium]
MRHAKRIKKLGRTSAHRKATLAALSSALIEHKRITTTLPKAKALRSFVEPIINRAKDDTTHNRRQAFRRLRNKEAVKTLFGEVAEVLGSRPGGYTRVVKLGQRSGDAAEMAIIELVDFNDIKPEGATSGKKKTRRSRRKSTDAVPAATASTDGAVADEAVEKVEDAIEVAEEEVAEVIEEATAEVEEAVEV